MKKLYFLLAAMLVCTAVSAQQTKFGVRVRYSLAKFNASMGKLSVSTDNISNIDGGVFAEFHAEQVTFQPGLMYVMKGGGSANTVQLGANGYADVFSEINVSYLELPLNVLYNIELKPGKIFLGAGPYAGYGLSAKSKITANMYSATGNFVSTQTETEKGNFGSGEDDVRRFDYGVNFLAGFRIKNGLEINAGYGLGLANLNNTDELKYKNRMWSFGLGFFF